MEVTQWNDFTPSKTASVNIHAIITIHGHGYHNGNWYSENIQAWMISLQFIDCSVFWMMLKFELQPDNDLLKHTVNDHLKIMWHIDAFMEILSAGTFKLLFMHIRTGNLVALRQFLIVQGIVRVVRCKIIMKQSVGQPFNCNVFLQFLLIFLMCI